MHIHVDREQEAANKNLQEGTPKPTAAEKEVLEVLDVFDHISHNSSSL